MRCAADVPVSRSPALAVLVVGLHWAQLWVVWNHPWLWREAAALVPFLSMTGAGSAIALCVTLTSLALLAGRPAVRWRDLGWTPRQLGAALLTAAAVWAAVQLAALIDIAWTGERVARGRDVVGALLSASSEEVVYRLVALGGAMSLLSRRVSPPRALRGAIAISMVLFAVMHIPHDLAGGYLWNLERYPFLLAYGGLMALVYLQTGNLMTAALLHMLSNEPALIEAGPHAQILTTVINWTACGVVIVSHAVARARERAGTVDQPF